MRWTLLLLLAACAAQGDGRTAATDADPEAMLDALHRGRTR
jgi:hypothetical protein